MRYRGATLVANNFYEESEDVFTFMKDLRSGPVGARRAVALKGAKKKKSDPIGTTY